MENSKGSWIPISKTFVHDLKTCWGRRSRFRRSVWIPHMPRMCVAWPNLHAQYLRDVGAEAQVVETPGYPMVSGGWMINPAYPTVTIYNHMDVQPAQEPEWKQAPFAFQKDNGIYAAVERPMTRVRPSPPCSERGMPLSRACRSTCASYGNWKRKTGAPALRQDQKPRGDSSPGFGGDFGHHLDCRKLSRRCPMDCVVCSARGLSCEPGLRMLILV